MNEQDASNDQIRDSVEQLQKTMAGAGQPFMLAAAYQTIAHALGLALQNAVAQQQHSHMLRTAMTTAAANAMLEGRTAEAEAVLKLAESRLVNPAVGEELTQLQAVVRSLHQDLQNLAATAAAAAP